MGCHKLPYYQDRESLEEKAFYGKVCLGKSLKKQKITPKEYQYHLKDHLGNTRVTFTTAPKTIDFTLNYESDAGLPDDIAMFENVEPSSIIANDLMDHTDAGTTYTNSQLLNGASGSIVGSVLTIPVGKGDQINAEVYAKYMAATGTSNPVSSIAGLVIGAITGNTGSSNYEGAINGATASSGGSLVDALGSGVSSSEPKAFINLMFLADDATDIGEFAYKQVTGSSNNTHAILALDQAFEAPSSGYVVVYLSNESSMLTEVYFDDLSITVNESKIIQTDSYYPFGLTFNSYQRSTEKENKYLFNQGTGDKKFDTERITDLDLNWDMTKLRTYDYTIGRFLQVDPLADVAGQESLTPYHYSLNNPIRWNDPLGDCTGPDCPKVKASGPSAGTEVNNNSAKAYAHIAKVDVSGTDSFNVGGTKVGEKANFGINVLNAEAEAKGEINEKGVSGQASLSVIGLGMELGGAIGGEKNNVGVKVKGEVGIAKAGVGIELGKNGASIGAEAGVYGGKAEGAFTFTIAGVKIELKGEITGASLHAGARAGAIKTDGKTTIGANAHIGAGAGGGLGFSITW